MILKDCSLLFYADQNGRKQHSIFTDENYHSISVPTVNNNQIQVHRLVWMLLHKQHACIGTQQREAYAVDRTN
jgi:hypothetical protein